MPEHTEAVDVAIIGGGIIGLSVAWRARVEGLSVTVLERDEVGRATSYVAAGMLAPVSEAEFGEAGGRLLGLGLRSTQMWQQFAAELEEASGGVEVGLLRTGTLMLARDEDEARELERQLKFRMSLGLHTERLRPSEAREREPALAPTLRLALEAPNDHSVDPRRVLSALRVACERAGVRILEHAEVASVALDAAHERVTGLIVHDETQMSRARATHVRTTHVHADKVVLAAGAWSGRIGGLPDEARAPVRPVKGQILRLRDPAGPGLSTRVLRFEGGYLVPRGDGRYVLGASVEEKGFALTPTAGAVYELLRDATELVPGIDELEIEELSVGLRPGTPDNLPLIGQSALAGLTWATGHYRNGILLAPLTAELVADVLVGTGAEAAPAAGIPTASPSTAGAPMTVAPGAGVSG